MEQTAISISSKMSELVPSTESRAPTDPKQECRINYSYYKPLKHTFVYEESEKLIDIEETKEIVTDTEIAVKLYERF